MNISINKIWHKYICPTGAVETETCRSSHIKIEYVYPIPNAIS